MKATRRGFLEFLAASPVIGPSIAKEAAKISQLNVNGVALATKLLDSDSDDFIPKLKDGNVKKPGLHQQLTTLIERSKFFKTKGVPYFQKQQWFDNYHCHMLDVDLAVNRSMSLVAKLNIQRERDWKKYEHEIINQSHRKHSILSDIYDKKTKREMVKLGLMKKDDHLLGGYNIKTSTKYDSISGNNDFTEEW